MWIRFGINVIRNGFRKFKKGNVRDKQFILFIYLNIFSLFYLLPTRLIVCHKSGIELLVYYTWLFICHQNKSAHNAYAGRHSSGTNVIRTFRTLSSININHFSLRVTRSIWRHCPAGFLFLAGIQNWIVRWHSKNRSTRRSEFARTMLHEQRPEIVSKMLRIQYVSVPDDADGDRVVWRLKSTNRNLLSLS